MIVSFAAWEKSYCNTTIWWPSPTTVISAVAESVVGSTIQTVGSPRLDT